MSDSLTRLVRQNGVPTDAQAHQIRHILTCERQKMHSNSGYDPRRFYFLRLLAGTLSAIKRFPPEILSIIFIFCRDLDVASSDLVYATTDLTLAPLLLVRICSRWRQVALDTPRLWDTLTLQTALFAKDGADAFIAELLRRSHVLPLSLAIETPESIIRGQTWFTFDGQNSYHDRWLDCLWTNPTTRHRLRSLNLYLFEADYTPNIFPLPETAFPALAHLALTVEGNREPNLPLVLSSFTHAPSLLSLELVVQYCCSDAILEAIFPWDQLTTLKLSLALTSDVAHTILTQCTSLERSTFSDIFEWDSETLLHPPPPQPALLAELRDFDFGWGHGSQTNMVLGGLSLPKLRSLTITSGCRSDDVEEPPTPVLLALHARSHFALEHLALSGQLLTPAELLSVLRIMPTLRTLNLRECACITDELFALLTANDSLTTLPELTKLEIHPITPTLDGNVVVTMAESLFAKSRAESRFANSRAESRYEKPGAEDPTPMFPSLTRLCLYRGHEQFVDWEWEKFADGIERRFAVLCETGFLVDRYPHT